jgi:hypothetical protein
MLLSIVFLAIEVWFWEFGSRNTPFNERSFEAKQT